MALNLSLRSCGTCESPVDRLSQVTSPWFPDLGDGGGIWGDGIGHRRETGMRWDQGGQ